MRNFILPGSTLPALLSSPQTDGDGWLSPTVENLNQTLLFILGTLELQRVHREILLLKRTELNFISFLGQPNLRQLLEDLREVDIGAISPETDLSTKQLAQHSPLRPLQFPVEFPD